MTDTRKRNAAKIAAKVIEARAVLALFDEKTIAEMLRRGERAAIPDGLNPVSLEGGGGGSDSTSVESAALRGLPSGDPDEHGVVKPDDWSRHVQPDPIGEYIAEILQRIDEVSDNCRILNKRRQVVIHSADGRRGRQPTIGHCEACQRVVPGSDVDRLRSGYCNYVDDVPWSGCYRMWINEGRPDRLAFERSIASRMAVKAEQIVRAEAEARYGAGVTLRLPKTQLPNSSIVREQQVS